MGAAHPIALDRDVPDLAKRYFDLGWDYAAYASHLPESAPAEMRQGWEEGRRRVKQRPASKFDRKWLLLRFNALRRNRLVDESVTPQLIQRITPKLCPVLGAPMTCGTGGDLDWSVDRIFNRGGYAEANIAIMSVRANNAKGSKDIRQVDEIACHLMNTGGTEAGLTGREWAHLAALMVGPHTVATGEAIRYPQCTVLPAGLVSTVYQIFQDAILRETVFHTRVKVLGRLRTLSPPPAARHLHRLIQAIKHKALRNAWIYDVWLEPGVFERFRDWVSAVPTDQLRAMYVAIMGDGRAWQHHFDGEEVKSSWGLLSGGYAT